MENKPIVPRQPRYLASKVRLAVRNGNRLRVLLPGALALAGTAAASWVSACGSGRGDFDDGGGSGAGFASGGDTGSGGNAAPSCDNTSFSPVSSACDAMCAALYDRGCTFTEAYVPSPTNPVLFNLYSIMNESFCQETCKRTEPDSGPCNVELAAWVNCLQTAGTCQGSAADDFVYLKTEACSAERQTLFDCGIECGIIPVCDSSTCGGSQTVGDLFCTYACQGGQCAASCN